MNAQVACIERCPPDCHILTCAYYDTQREPAVDDDALARVKAYAVAYDLVPRDPDSPLAKRIT